MKTQIALLTLLSAGLWSAFSQGFVNLDFNAAQLSAYGAGPVFVPASNAIPGWTGYLGTNQQTSVLYNSISTGEANLSILGAGNQGVIPGNNYTVVLQEGVAPAGGYFTSASIAQTGLIPANAQSIYFTATLPAPSLGGWQITIAGRVIPVIQISSVGSAAAVYGGNVSAFAGQVAELEFTDLAGSGFNASLGLDAISFSSSPIPEPSVFRLFALGGSLLAWRCRRILLRTTT